MKGNQVKKVILKKIKIGYFWKSKLYRTLIQEKIDVSWPWFLACIKELIKDEKVIIVEAGRNKILKLKKKERRRK